MPQAKDITGNRYGRLVALEYSHTNDRKERVWRCKCDCGNEIYVGRAYLVKGNTRSCGCLLSDSRHRRRKVVQPNCFCHYCGKSFYLIKSRLDGYRHHFCNRDCWKAYLKEHPEETSNYKEMDAATRFFSRKILRVRASAKKRNIPFSAELKTSDFVDLWNKQKGRCYYSGIPLSFDKNDKICLVSVDRVDNSKGYELGNIVLCASSINSFKFTYPKEELMRLISLIREYGR